MREDKPASPEDIIRIKEVLSETRQKEKEHKQHATQAKLDRKKLQADIKREEKQLKEQEKQLNSALKQIEDMVEQGYSKMVLSNVVNAFNNLNAMLKETDLLGIENPIENLKKQITKQFEEVKNNLSEEQSQKIDAAIEKICSDTKELGELVNEHAEKMVSDVMSKNSDFKAINELRDARCKKEKLDPKCFTLEMNSKGEVFWKVNENHINTQFENNNPKSVIDAAKIEAGKLNGNEEFKKHAENFRNTMNEVKEGIENQPEVKGLWEKIVQFIKECLSQVRMNSAEHVQANAMKHGKNINREIKGKFTEKATNEAKTGMSIA